FDYVGNTIGFAIYGDHRKKAKWKNIVRYARDEDLDRKHNRKPLIARSKIAPLISDTDKSLVDRLYEYRSELIHYETDPVKGSVKTILARNEADATSLDVTFDVSITVPARFKKFISVPGWDVESKNAPLTVASDWLIAVRWTPLSRH